MALMDFKALLDGGTSPILSSLTERYSQNLFKSSFEHCSKCNNTCSILILIADEIPIKILKHVEVSCIIMNSEPLDQFL